MNKLKSEILELIDFKIEGEYWDFKEFHHDNTASLLHDIICMANNRADRDAYIIFGVKDKDYSIVGLENDSNRRNQQQMIDQLKDKSFAGGVRPTVYLRTIKIDKNEIDVLIIKNSTDTPFYLEKKFQDKGKTVNPYYIYTRVGDTNTDINKSADIDKVEYLWKKRLRLNKAPLDQIIKKLENKEDWITDDECVYYNKYNPEYTIALIDDYDENYIRDKYEYYSYAMTNESTSYGTFEIKSYGTKLYSNRYVVLDSGRYKTSIPSWKFLNFDKYDRYNKYALKYFIKTDIDYKMHKFLFNDSNDEAIYAHDIFIEVVLIFNDEFEKDSFLEYLNENREIFKAQINNQNDKYSYISCATETEKSAIIKDLLANEVANEFLIEFRNKSNYKIGQSY